MIYMRRRHGARRRAIARCALPGCRGRGNGGRGCGGAGNYNSRIQQQQQLMRVHTHSTHGDAPHRTAAIHTQLCSCTTSVGHPHVKYRHRHNGGERVQEEGTG